MNIGRYIAAVLGVWVVRVVSNYLFYEIAMAERYQELTDANPGIFREVIPAYITLDLLVAIVFTFLVVKAVSAFGGGIKGGLTLGGLVALVGVVAGNFYLFYSFTIFEVGGVVIESVYALVALAIQGAVAAAIYKPAAPPAEPASTPSPTL